MRFLRCFLSFAALLWFATLGARADVVTNFTLTHGSDTIQFAIADFTPFSFRVATFGVEEFDYQIPFTLNGTVFQTGANLYPAIGFESLQAPGIGAELYVGYRSVGANGVSQYTYYFEQDVQVYTNVNGRPVFTPGTITFPQVTYASGGVDHYGSGDTLVITQTDSSAPPVPEPSSLALALTGLAGGLAAGRRRLGR